MNRSALTREEVGLLVDDNGVVARTVDADGNLPLHYVCDDMGLVYQIGGMIFVQNIINWVG